ncbi:MULTISPECIES: response regulator [Methylomonas]|uniref:Response regulator receiver protein n=1 Tax=Methylomonas koyamae TaxID=702114 RepID=A0A177NEP5_9GAMM|nr:response regulator [Methylomonas koyamae]OAI16395.1 response regulator receiver protein [Methylomonas koyamae]
MNAQPASILIVDDEPNILKALNRLLRPYQVVSADSGEQALVLAGKQPFDLVISDYRMPGMDGISFLMKFMVLQPDAVRLILTGYADLEATQQAINEIGVFRFLNKPWNNHEIVNAVEKGLELKRVLLENRRLADQVRDQQTRLDQQEAILRALEAEEPGITKVNWGPDGSIILDPADLDDNEPLNDWKR